jgi:hypothetical protein
MINLENKLFSQYQDELSRVCMVYSEQFANRLKNIERV